MTLDPRLLPVHALMRTAVAPPGDETDLLYRWLAYQLGWADAEGQPADARTAKGIRPLVCLISCTAVGGRPESAAPVAAAIELTHEFSLIHDDIEDGDRLRRGRPTLWSIFGQEQAINAGDAMFAIGRRQLGEAPVPPDVALDLQRRYDEACTRLAEGQFLDLFFESAERVSVAEYVAMVRRKTGALLGAAAGMGARVGGADPSTADALARYGEGLGVAFQMQDDVLGLWGDEALTGKPAGRDLERRKQTMPVILAMEDPELGPGLDALHADGAPTAAAVAAMADAMAAAGLRERTADEAGRWSGAALDALGELELDEAARYELEDLVRRAVDRQR